MEYKKTGKELIVNIEESCVALWIIILVIYY